MQLILDQKRDIRATVSKYNDKTYLHIRSWWKNRPTKTGVSLQIDDWNQLMLHLDPCDEMRYSEIILL